MSRGPGSLALAALVTTLPGPAGGQELLTADDVISMPSPPPEHRVPYGPHELQYGHLRLPAGGGPHPVVVFIHGGCWLAEYGIRHVGRAEAALADAGYAVWSLEYRRVGDPGGGWPGTFLDVAAGVDHLRELARHHPLDPEQVVTAGHSAGGQLALWAAARPRLPRSSPIHVGEPLPVRGVLALAPAAPLADLHRVGICGGVVDDLMGGAPAEHPERYDAASPVRLAPLGVPQRLVVGARDDTWTPHARTYHRRAVEAGDIAVTLRTAPASGHFEMIVPGSDAWSLVLEELEALYREVEGAR